MRSVATRRSPCPGPVNRARASSSRRPSGPPEWGRSGRSRAAARFLAAAEEGQDGSSVRRFGGRPDDGQTLEKDWSNGWSSNADPLRQFRKAAGVKRRSWSLQLLERRALLSTRLNLGRQPRAFSHGGGGRSEEAHAENGAVCRKGVGTGLACFTCTLCSSDDGWKCRPADWERGVAEVVAPREGFGAGVVLAPRAA
jgi:hypothetical protein